MKSERHGIRVGAQVQETITLMHITHKSYIDSPGGRTLLSVYSWFASLAPGCLFVCLCFSSFSQTFGCCCQVVTVWSLIWWCFFFSLPVDAAPNINWGIWIDFKLNYRGKCMHSYRKYCTKIKLKTSLLVSLILQMCLKRVLNDVTTLSALYWVQHIISCAVWMKRTADNSSYCGLVIVTVTAKKKKKV